MLTYLKKIRILFWVIAGISCFALAPAVNAQGDVNPFTTDLTGGVASELPSTVTTTDASPQAIPNLVIRIIKLFLSFLGLIAIVVVLYAGFRWMTAGGNSEQVMGAKKTLRNAMIGLVLIFMAYGISYWVGRRIQVATGSFGSGGTVGITAEGGFQFFD